MKRATAVSTLAVTLLAAGAAGCRRPPAPPPTPTAVLTVPPVTIALTPTSKLPANLELSGNVPSSIEWKLTASAPATPRGVGESSAERSERLAPATPVPPARTPGV